MSPNQRRIIRDAIFSMSKSERREMLEDLIVALIDNDPDTLNDLCRELTKEYLLKGNDE